MKLAHGTGVLLLGLGVAASLAGTGCGKDEDKGSQVQKQARATDKDTARTGHTHADWWCAEHGVPEHLCIMCSDTLMAKAKKEGDWCEHDRAKSQCFRCTPAAREYYARMYRERYGKEPPAATEQEEPAKEKQGAG